LAYVITDNYFKQWFSAIFLKTPYVISHEKGGSSPIFNLQLIKQHIAYTVLGRN